MAFLSSWRVAHQLRGQGCGTAVGRLKGVAVGRGVRVGRLVPVATGVAVTVGTAVIRLGGVLVTAVTGVVAGPAVNDPTGVIDGAGIGVGVGVPGELVT